MAESSRLSRHEFDVRMVIALLAIAAAVALAAFLWAARLALLVIYISALVAMAFAPLVARIERWHARGSRRRIPRWLAILAIYLAVIAGFALLAFVIIPPLAGQISDLSTALPKQFDRLQAFLRDQGLLQHRYTLREAVQQVPATDPTAPAQEVTTVVHIGSTMVEMIAGLISVAILSYYLLVDAGGIYRGGLAFVPKRRQPEVQRVARKVVTRVSLWLQAHAVLGLIMGSVTGFVLALIGEPFFYVVAAVAAFGEIIPMIGPLIAGGVAVLLALTSSGKLALIVGGIFLALHEIEANLLVPRIMEQRVGLNAAGVVIALLIGWEAMGILGAVLSVPTATIVAVGIDEMKRRNEATS